MNKRACRADSHRAHLSRINSLLIVLNISRFFLTDPVIRQGVSLHRRFTGFLTLTTIGPMFGFGLLNRLWYYLKFILSEIAGSYLLISSVRYWVRTNSGS
jgi:hypothetical protein